MSKRVSIFSIIMLFLIIFMSGCAETEGADDTQLLSRLNNRVIKTVLENDESGGTITTSNIVIDQAFCGSFSKPEAEEVLVVCRILDMPHVGGLDRRAIIILDADSMNVVAYNEILADEVWISRLPVSNGQDRIIFSAKSTYQGISTQNVMYFCIQNGQWTEIPVEELEALGEDSFCFLTGDVMIVTSNSELTDTSYITAILTWNQDVGKFISEQSSENPNMLTESEIIEFNTGFFNSETNIMNNMLLSSEYMAPDEINLFQLFYNGIDGTEGQISEEELELLTEMDSAALNLDIMKISMNEMDNFLRKKMGIGLDETQKTGLNNFYYLKEYDSYYVIAGDTNYERCTVLSGFWESDGRLRMVYTKEGERERWEVTLQKVKDGYLFVSNVKSD
ncbi:MAG: hypothetical protein K2H45_07155 [Acetatifactor sp.]|nr:hypothetical protein [Acetatifactor sp.]